MGAMSNYTESGVLNLLLRSNSNSFAAPSVVALALTRDHPTDTQTGATINELTSAGSYARLSLGAPDNADWNDVTQVNGSGLVDNAANLDFATADADWGGVSGIAICNNASIGGGEVLFHGPLTTFRNVTNGDTFRFSAGDLDVLLD